MSSFPSRPSSAPTTAPAPPAPVRPQGRVHALDALRGFALCGIIFVNIPQTLDMMPVLGDAPEVLRLFVVGRFYPIFFLLFGVGFGLFLRSAAKRTDRPRPLLVRRLVALGVVGALHHLLQPGEVLLPFAVTGLLVLLPLSFCSGRVNLVVGLLLTVLGLVAGVGGLGLLPGLFVLGFAFAQLGVATRLPERTTALVVSSVVAAVVAAGSYWVVVHSGAAEGVTRRVGLLFSFSMAAAYAAAFLALLAVPVLGSALTALLAPLGRLALTNYLSATLLFVALGTALGLPGSSHWAVATALGAGILLAQAAWSPLWTRHFRYGPAEWAWRCVTYWRWLPARVAPADGASR
ncbi:DUF418 domain-containing protein [Actinoalloteichus caeruleus]|uniref:DUF418 domain-containing protein n=1 Tax=Actinoalloteichus cyanogriseus TaxID=2893586 RepID=UPI000AC848A2|nr:DUF418 domain-containing protein [Actinoalloteichus caeruleus]